MKAKNIIIGVKKIILILSNKGGVGKSTISSLIAEQLNIEGYKVGIADLDLSGPSIPQIFGVNKMPKILNNKIIPLESRGISIISTGFFIDHNSLIAWRGPIANKVVCNLLSFTNWDNLDFLIIDTPPGINDIHLSILKYYQLDGVLIISTPQKMTITNNCRSIDLCIKLNVPILGIIENMSYIVEANLNIKPYIISFNNKEQYYKNNKYHNIPLICKIPILSRLSYYCDNSKSLVEVLNMSTSFLHDMII